MLGQEELVLPHLVEQEEETPVEEILKELQEKVDLSRQARELSNNELFKELVDVGYLVKHRDIVRERLVSCIETDRPEEEKAYRAELHAINSFRTYLENIEAEGASAAEYITEYEKIKQEEEENADQ